MIALLSALAFAADPPRLDHYPTVAPIELPAAGVSRVHVPPSLRSFDDPADGTDLLLVNGAGEALPVAWIRGDVPARMVSLDVRPTFDRDVYEVQPPTEPLDAIDVDPGYGRVARVTVERQDGGKWTTIAADELVWNLDGGTQPRVRFPSTQSALRVTFRLLAGDPTTSPSFTGARHPWPDVQPDVLTIPVATSHVDEGGDAVYEVPLPYPVPVARVRLHAQEDVFERSAWLGAADASWTGDTRTVRRVEIGGAHVDDVTLDGMHRVLTSLVVHVSSAGQTPLTIDAVDVEIDGLHGLVRDPGAGPLQIYAQAPAGTSPGWDLTTAAPELAKLAGAAVDPGAPAPNPAYVPPEVRSDLASPSTVLDLKRWKWQSAVEGRGLSRIALPDDVLAGSRPDLADVRLVDADGRQIPFVLRRDVVEHPWGALKFDRDEREQTSWLRVHLPRTDVPVSSVTLSTPATLFTRTVTVSRSRGADLETLRAAVWQGADRPGKLTLQVDERAGDDLVVTIDNGSNPPLPIDGVEATWPSWEVIAVLPDRVLPEGGARLVYGDLRAEAPVYDLSLVDQDLVRRATSSATVGPKTSLEPPPPSFADRAVLMGGIVVMVLGLLGLTARLVLATPDTSDKAPAGG